MTILKFYAEDGKYSRVLADGLFEKKKNWFIGWKCLAGTRSLSIDHEGKVHSAVCRSLGTYGRTGSYGNVFTEFHLEKNPINCARRFCETEFDLSIPKYHKPKYREVFDLESSEVEAVETSVAVRGESDEYKKIQWDVSQFQAKPLSQWKKAVHSLETFLKGEVGRFILQNPPVQSRDFSEFLRFLAEEKGHSVTVEGSPVIDVGFYQRAFESSDLILRCEGEERAFFEALDRIGETFRELRARRIFRKVVVQVDIKSPEYGRLRQMLLSDPYRSWLEPGFFLGKFILPQASAAPVVEGKKAERISLSGARILLFIPMRNCEGTIAKVIARMDKEILDYVDEILILDNDSPDNSIAEASKAVKNIRDVKAVVRKNEKNYGFGGSHKLALQYAYQRGHEYVLVVHGDDSGSPQDFLPLLKSGKFKESDLVLSTRLTGSATRENYPVYRYLGNLILNFLSSLVTLTPVKDFTGGPVNLLRVQTFMNKFDHPVKRFDDRISFLQHAFLYVHFRRGTVMYWPVSYREAGGKTVYSAVTQFLRAVLLLTLYPVKKKTLFR